ncbi:hypothetical protein ERO13_D05G300800v2 [Gossypium hirsutum]|uniref:F-box protein At2g39490 isoform X1 n=5 Tax=Gossypium TaxID=3633 RepID=A0A1U8J6B3_GOSHI|nr:F-box protein At2g39490 isoform X1 [Gossypium hirsutum]KAG4148694.1 hypothetical protein ERO13_D05G300800v2 [Gossypium hirsutum]TYI83899.1 hypothetical protein E1A91_D05G326000v1 [Gossypium mustelinum]
MGKKGRSKKNNQDKQRHDLDDDNPRNTSASSNNSMDPNDFISHLPDNILHQIILFLPVQSAVLTSFLSTHWKHLWKEALLEPVHDVVTMEAAIEAIKSFLDDFDTHYRPRNKWGFIFELGHGRGILVSSISSNGSLKLDFSASKPEFPRPFDLLLKLDLAPPNAYWWLLEENHSLQTQQPSSNTTKVKSLHLISVSHLSNVAVSSLLPNLPFLRSLTIAKCNGLQSLQIKEAKALRKLVVLDCPHLQSLSFEGSNLKSFRYRGKLVSFQFRDNSAFWGDCWFFLEDVMVDIRQGSLTQWTWDFETETSFFRHHYGLCKRNHWGCTSKYTCFNSILRSIKNVKSLTICRWFYETSICKKLPFSSRHPECYLSQLKELWWIDCSTERESINALLCFLKLCPKLERLYVTLDPKSYNLPSAGKFSALVTVPDKLYDLKVVKLEGFADEEKENFIARRLVPLFGENNPVIISKSKGKCLKHLVKIAKLEKKGKYPYKFKMVKNIDEKFLDHVHMKL